MTENFAWFLITKDPFSLLRIFGWPVLILFGLYGSNHLLILIRITLQRLSILSDSPPPPDKWPSALIVIPTILGSDDDITGLQKTVLAVLENGYSGELTICVALDYAALRPDLVTEFQNWYINIRNQPNRLLLVQLNERHGKAMAMNAAVQRVKARVQEGDDEEFPEIFFNLDADTMPAPGTLSRLAARLLKKKFSGERPMIVTSNVAIHRTEFWQGWRHLFSIEGQLALQVEREYSSSIGLGRQNFGIFPVTGISGALYCTWSALQLQGPRFGGFLATLRFRDLILWWLGKLPPSLKSPNILPCPERSTGPGDDTWMAWLALGARWKDGQPTLEFPDSPWQAFCHLFYAYFQRPIAFDPKAIVYTGSPSTVRGLYRQRLRWNTNRIWLRRRFGIAPYFNWALGLPIVFNLLLKLAVHFGILAGFLLWLIVTAQPNWLPLLFIAYSGYFGMRVWTTLLAALQEGQWDRAWPKFLAVPLSLPYHFVFNVLPTIDGIIKEFLGFGLNTGFAPENTLERSGVGRIAISYRLRRVVLLTLRSLRYGDIPFGRFWFGWEETPWTSNGYTGWTNDANKRPHVLARGTFQSRTEGQLQTAHRAAGVNRPLDDKIL